ncbi:MAG TPA: hypothetical protein VF223_22540 [Trebonia sp.]
MDEELRAELLRRVEKDQDARKAQDWDGMLEADAENLPWLKAVVAERGWPGASVVGTDGANGAWLLAQHADAGLGAIAEYLTRFTEQPEPSRLKCPECNGQVPFELPDDFSQPLTVTCPECGREMTLTFGR